MTLPDTARAAASSPSAAGLVAASASSGCGATSRLGAAAVADGNAITVDELQQATRDYLQTVPGADAGDAQRARSCSG